jgi:hypothetical protein
MFAPPRSSTMRLRRPISSSLASGSKEERFRPAPVVCTTWHAPRSGLVIRLNLMLFVADVQGQCEVHRPGRLGAVLDVSCHLDEVQLRNLTRHHVMVPVHCSDRIRPHPLRVPRPVFVDVKGGSHVFLGR